MTVAIDIAVEHEAWRALGDLGARVTRMVEAALAIAGVKVAANAELSLMLCDDAFIRDLNHRWRGMDKATNVLSFPSVDRAMLGDIVVAYETCVREADDEGRSLGDYLAHMVVHGVLHLVGFDHEDDADAEEMEQLEALALAQLGIASPYAAEAAP